MNISSKGKDAFGWETVLLPVATGILEDGGKKMQKHAVKKKTQA